MRLDIEVRSSGPGPREREGGTASGPSIVMLPVYLRLWLDEVSDRWTRVAQDHNGRAKCLSDGVAVIIRRA